MQLDSRRYRALIVLTLALLAAPAARAGDDMVETSIGKTFPLTFDLGFKLPCKHEYTIMYGAEGFLEEVKPTELTGDTTFKFKALKVGLVSVTAFFTGPGGNCAGSASKQMDVMIAPDPKYTEKAWKSEVKAADKAYHNALKSLGKDFDATAHDIFDSFQLEALTSAEAADALFAAAQDAEDDAAFGGFLAMSLLSDTGTGMLSDGGLSDVPPSFQTGARSSLWTQFTYDLQEDYDDFVDDVYDEVDDALDDIAKERGTFFYTVYVNGHFPLALPAGPGLESDPVDVDTGPAVVMAGIAYSDNGVGALRWFGTGQMSAGDVAIDVTGPTGFVTQNEVATQTEFDVGSTWGKWSLSVDGLSLVGQYRLNVRYDEDTNDDYKLAITLPF